MTTEAAIWPYAVIPGVPDVYVCGCLERWVSIRLQAIRGLNLAWGLVDTGRLGKGASACVIGGGFTGLAVAAGLGRLGVRVTLRERNRELLGFQRHNRVRWIHPHVHEWPRASAHDKGAGLPLLDWRAGLSADMAAQVLSAFASEVQRSGIEVITSAPDVGLPAGFDATVLALGLGVERTFGALPLTSYWADETIGTIDTGGADRRTHFVTGIGEGGVIDALYLTLSDFSHAEFADRISAIAGMDVVAHALLALEDEVLALDDAAGNALLGERMPAIVPPRAVDALLASRVRTDTRVILNGPEACALAPRADMLNRFLLSRLLAIGALRYESGLLTDVRPAGDGYVVRLSSGTELTVDRVHIRHGTVPTLKLAFPDLWARYQPVRMALPHRVPVPSWPPHAWE